MLGYSQLKAERKSDGSSTVLRKNWSHVQWIGRLRSFSGMAA